MSEQKSLIKKLQDIQQELKVPKAQYNSFGGYKYRSCEDILRAVKPLLKKHDAILLLTDEVVSLDGRWYVKATAKFFDEANADKPITVCGYAREEETKKGMDGSQITGASSSYSRKYCLNGLFNLDDVKDSDSTNTHSNEGGASKATSSRFDFGEARKAMKEIGTVEELRTYWASVPKYAQKYLEEAKNNRKAELEGAKDGE